MTDERTITEFIAAEIPRTGDAVTYGPWVITNWGRIGPGGTPVPDPDTPPRPAEGQP